MKINTLRTACFFREKGNIEVKMERRLKNEYNERA